MRPMTAPGSDSVIRRCRLNVRFPTNDPTCADSGAQVLPPARATVPPSLRESSSRVSSLLACYALGPPASAAQYSCRREPCTGRSAWLPLGRAWLSAWIEHRSGEQRSPYPGRQGEPARAQSVRAGGQEFHRSFLTIAPPSLARRPLVPTLDAMPTEVILSRLTELPESPWGDLGGKPINDRKLGRRLREVFGVFGLLKVTSGRQPPA